MRCIDVERRHGKHGTTRVLVTKADGREFIFSVGRHVGVRRIYKLAQLLKLKEVA